MRPQRLTRVERRSRREDWPEAAPMSLEEFVAVFGLGADVPTCPITMSTLLTEVLTGG